MVKRQFKQGMIALLFVFLTVCTVQSETNQEGQCFDLFMENLGIDMDMETNVDLLNDILRNDMFLDDFQPVQELLSYELTYEVSLWPMLERIRNGINNRHAPVREGLCALLQEELIPFDKKNDPVINRMIHHMFLLNKIVGEMAADTDFMIDILNHMYDKRREAGVSDNFVKSLFDIYRLTGGVFEPIKTKTIDWALGDFVKFRTEGEISKKDSDSRRRGVIINVMEVVTADNLHGFEDNAVTGRALAINPPEHLIITGDNNAIEYVVNQEWMEVYQAWMLTFLTGNVPNLHLLYPKMIIPEVIDVDHHEYLFNRVLALGLTIDFILLAKADNRPDVEMPNAEAISQKLGEANVKHAKQYIKDHNKFGLLRSFFRVKALLNEFGKDVENFFNDVNFFSKIRN
ncbi:MAG: hypothetical protein GY710_17735 [Desulfobacteraceae bacterium]|nr:hypothetical protein [Desulfobacteraceae bacterium]